MSFDTGCTCALPESKTNPLVHCPVEGCEGTVCRVCSDSWPKLGIRTPFCKICRTKWTNAHLIKMCGKTWFNRVFKPTVAKKLDEESRTASTHPEENCREFNRCLYAVERAKIIFKDQETVAGQTYNEFLKRILIGDEVVQNIIDAIIPPDPNREELRIDTFPEHRREIWCRKIEELSSLGTSNWRVNLIRDIYVNLGNLPDTNTLFKHRDITYLKKLIRESGSPQTFEDVEDMLLEEGHRRASKKIFHGAIQQMFTQVEEISTTYWPAYLAILDDIRRQTNKCLSKLFKDANPDGILGFARDFSPVVPIYLSEAGPEQEFLPEDIFAQYFQATNIHPLSTLGKKCTIFRIACNQCPIDFGMVGGHLWLSPVAVVEPSPLRLEISKNL